MQYREAKKLEVGHKVRMRGRKDIMSVVNVEECEGYLGATYIIVSCETESGKLREVYHKKIIKVEE